MYLTILFSLMPDMAVDGLTSIIAESNYFGQMYNLHMLTTLINSTFISKYQTPLFQSNHVNSH